ncbi:FG-GAP repeat domain-containing protein [Streptomyces sp. NPDC004266]|uniref:FG-GAP repeat domain-containing protein n=1 Tax=Streptomyces sp. NPDC004266 TaxID=3364693 RepID=UPI0036AB5840
MRSTRARRRGRWAGALASALLTVGLLPQPAQAADVPNGAVVAASITTATPEDHWTLASTETTAVADVYRTRLAEQADQAEARGIPKKTVTDVLNDRNMTARPLCHPTNAAGAQGFCWDDTYGDDTGTQWVPQGIAGSGESAANQQIVSGRRIVVTSWSNFTSHPSYPGTPNQLMRVTFTDVTDPAKVTYRHVLLVTPTATGYEQLRGHADSVTWYRNYLYVSTGAGLAVFDLNRFWLMDASVGSVGASNGAYGAAWHKYALPQINRYQHRFDNPAQQDPLKDPQSCYTRFEANKPPKDNPPPCFAGISLDDSGAVPALVTTEMAPVPIGQQQSFNTPNAIVRWPLNPETGLLATEPEGPVGAKIDVVRPEAAYTSTISGANGVAMNRGRLVVSAACPEFIAGKTEIAGCLYHAWPGEPVRLWTRTGVYGENVMYWPSTNEMWTLNEKAGNRTVFHIPWPKPPVPVRSLAWGNLTGDSKPDLLAVRPSAGTESVVGNGNLVLYPGASDGVGARKSIGTNWDQMRLLTGMGPQSESTMPDFLAVDATGALWRYPGAQNGLGTRVNLSSGWGVVSSMSGVGDLTGDKLPDLMAVWNDGSAHLYPGTPAGGLGASYDIGSNWDAMPLYTGVGNLDQDPTSSPDVLAVDGAGVLWLYPGIKGDPAQGRQGKLGPRVELSKGWGVVRTMTGAGDLNDDGRPDVLAVWDDGSAHLYPGNSDGRLDPSTPVNLGWGTA